MMITLEKEAIGVMRTNTGQSLESISNQKPVLLVFLRHFGCQFCREALDDISKMTSEIERNGLVLVFVHMADREVAETYFAKFNLSGSLHISDPECRFYAAFGLVKGSFSQLFGLHAFLRGFSVQSKYGAEIGKRLGDSYQMPGIFGICNGLVRLRFLHKDAAVRPDYNSLVKRCCETE